MISTFVPGQTVGATGFPPMTIQSINGNSVICSYFEEVTRTIRDVQFWSWALYPAAPAAPVGLSQGAVTIPLGANGLEVAFRYKTIWPPQCVVADAGVVPFTFNPGPPFSPGPLTFGNAYIEIVANGFSAAPVVNGAINLYGQYGGTYNNIAGMINGLNLQSDGFDIWYYWTSYGPIPTPTTFVAALNGTTLTVGFGGEALGSVTPPVTAFSLVAARSGRPAPYFLSSINPINSGDTQLVLNISGDTFQAGDVIQLSYNQPASNPLQGQSNAEPSGSLARPAKVALWLNAVATVQ
jgi:hypothetical protein